jgi:hypothetical protein
MRRRLGVALALILAVIAGVASASAITGGQGTDTPQGPEAVQPDGSGASLPTTATDPDGRAAWAVRVYRSKAGLTCPEAGRTKDGSFGRVDGDGEFRPLSIEAAGTCVDLGKEPMSLAVNHHPAQGKLPARAVLFGVTTNAVAGLTLTTTAGPRDVRIVRGAFITVLLEQALKDAVLEVTMADGSKKSYALAPNDAPATIPKEPATE